MSITPNSRTKTRRGRNPSIDAAKIKAAVSAVSAQQKDLSMKEVADYLGVNVTTLYRHIGGIDGLRRIRAGLLQEALAPLPSPEGIEWQTWLQNLSDYYRDALLSHPDLLEFAQAAMDPDFENLEREARILVQYGFEPRAALLTHSFLITTITGYVHQELQTQLEADSGYTHYFARLFHNLDQHPDRLPTLHSVNLNQRAMDRDANFKAVIDYAIAGIAAQPGAPNIND